MLPGTAGTSHTVDIIAFWTALAAWSSPVGALPYTIPGTPPPPPMQAPYLGAPLAIPGIIEAEHYDTGGSGVAYLDSDPGNNGGASRTDDVDLQTSSESGANVGWILAGEWLEYTVVVAQTGTYTLNARVASLGQGGVFHLDMDGADITGAMTIPDTGGWQNWTTLTKAVSLVQGPHVLRVSFDAPTGPSLGNLNFLTFATVAPCTFSLVPTSQAVNAIGGSSSVAVSASVSTCAWTAISNVSWIAVVSGASGIGNGVSGYLVAANTGAQRSGTLTIGGQTFTVDQAAYVPPPQPPSGCLYDGMLYPTGYILGPISMPNNVSDAWLQARLNDGWTLFSRRRSRGTTTFRIKCGP